MVDSFHYSGWPIYGLLWRIFSDRDRVDRVGVLLGKCGYTGGTRRSDELIDGMSEEILVL